MFLAVAPNSFSQLLLKIMHNLKALYRRAQAELGLQNFAQVVRDCKSVIGIDANNKDARTLLKHAHEEHHKSKGSTRSQK